MNFIRLYIYPVCIAILIPILVIVPYLVALHNEHVNAFLPYTTDTGALPVESGIFAQILLIIGLLMAVLSYLQYLQLNTIYTLSDNIIQLKASIMKNKKRIIKFNRWSLYTSMYIVLVITSIVSFRSNEFPIIHPILCITLFIAIIILTAMKSWISLRLSPQINSKVMAKVRIVIVILLIITFILAIACGIWSFAVTKNTKPKERMHWNSKDDGYVPHIISSISQWIFVLLLSPFFATYFGEMKSMTIHNGVLRLTFKTTTLKTTTVKTSKTQKNKTNQTKIELVNSIDSFVSKTVRPDFKMNSDQQTFNSNQQIPEQLKQNEHLSLTQSIGLSEEIISKLLETSDLQKALDTIEPYADRSIYHSFTRALCLIVISLCTFDKPDIENASKAVDELSNCCNKYRKTGLRVNLMKIIKTPNYQKYTDLESHAELIHSFSIAMGAFVYALNTYNVYGLIRIAYRLQKFLKHYKASRQLFRMKTQWENNESRITYEAAIRLSNGFCHLIISTIPPKLLKIINFLGYGGIESRGWLEINKTAFNLTGMFSQFARLFLIFYWSYAEPHGFQSTNNLENLSLILDKEIERYPNSIFLGGFRAKYEQLCGQIDKSIESFNQLIDKKAHLSYDPFQLELMFCYALKCQWSESIKFAEILREQSAHTPACGTYAEALFRYVQSQDLSDQQMKDKASQLFKLVPNLCIRHFGKTMTPEKVVVVNSEKYFRNQEFLILPELELLYQYNYLSFIRGNTQLLNTFMDRIDKQIDRFKDDIVGSDYLDNYLTALFYRGVILKLMGDFKAAKQCFNEVLNDEYRIGREYSIPPKAVMELGLIELDLKNYEIAEKLLTKSINDYSNYLYENYVHLRAYAGLRSMGLSLNTINEDEVKLEEYRKQWLKDIEIEDKNYHNIIQNEEING